VARRRRLRAQPPGGHTPEPWQGLLYTPEWRLMPAGHGQAYRALVPGASILLETPNPENILVGSHTFYHDPTHRNPLTPNSVAFFLRYCGFADPEIRRLHPYPEAARVQGDDDLTARVNGHLCGPQDFAVIARKPRTLAQCEISPDHGAPATAQAEL